MEKVYEATIEFNSNEDANKFAINYSRKTLRGHTVAQNKVSIYGITEKDKIWIDEYIAKLNKTNNLDDIFNDDELGLLDVKPNKKHQM